MQGSWTFRRFPFGRLRSATFGSGPNAESVATCFASPDSVSDAGLVAASPAVRGDAELDVERAVPCGSTSRASARTSPARLEGAGANPARGAPWSVLGIALRAVNQSRAMVVKALLSGIPYFDCRAGLAPMPEPVVVARSPKPTHASSTLARCANACSCLCPLHAATGSKN